MGRVVNNVGEGALAPLSAAFVVENVWAQADKDPAAFQTQRPDVPVMTPTEVLAKLTKTLSDDPALFLEKYGKFLDHQTLAYFEAEPLSNVYEVKFFATRLRNELAGKRPSAVTMRNRRYRKLQELQTEGEYFTEEAMKERNPALYEHYIGRYLSQEERTVPFSVDSRLSDILLHNYDSDRLKADADNEIAQEQRSHRQAEPDAFEKDDDLMNDEEIAALARLQQRHQSRMYRMDVGQDEEEEEDEEDKEEDDDDQAPSPPPVNIPVISVAEKEQLRKDFLHLMEQHFLNGQDASFNYAEVDMSEEYDDWQQSNADAADKYFEDEDPDDTPLDEEL